MYVYTEDDNRLMMAQAAAREEVARMRAREKQEKMGAYPNWISVREKLPERVMDESGYCINYLIYSSEYGVDIGNYLEEVGIWVCLGTPADVTHLDASAGAAEYLKVRENPREARCFRGYFHAKNEKKAPVVCAMLYIRHKKR